MSQSNGTPTSTDKNGINHPGMERAAAYSDVRAATPATHPDLRTPATDVYIEHGSKTISMDELERCLRSIGGGTFRISEVIDRCLDRDPTSASATTPREPAIDNDCHGRQCDW